MTNKITIPKEITLLDGTYKIKYVIPEKIEGTTPLNSLIVIPINGMIDLDNKIIFINKELNDELKMIVLLHELGHYFSVYYRLENSEMFADVFSRFFKNVMEQLK